MIPLRLLSWVMTCTVVLIAVTIGLTIYIAPQVNDSWTATYATTNSSHSYWRLHLVDMHRDVFFNLVDTDLSAAGRPALSPNERYVVLEGTRLVVMDLWTDQTYTMQQGGGNVVWTSDSRQFAYLHEGEVYVTVVDEATGPSDLLMPLGIRLPDYLVGWSPDGTQLVYIYRDSVRLLDTTTGQRHTLIADDTANFLFADWSPDGRHLLVSYSDERDLSQYSLALLPMQDLNTTPEPTLLFDNLNRVVNLKWSPDGQRILIVERPSNVRTMRVISLLPEQGLITSDLHLPLDAQQVQWSPNGRRLLFINGRDADLYVMDAVGSNLRRLTDNNRRNMLLR